MISDTRRSSESETHLNNRRILLRTLGKLLIAQLGVLVLVHVSEDLVDALGKGIGVSLGVTGKRAQLPTFSGVSSSSGSLTIWPVIL